MVELSRENIEDIHSAVEVLKKGGVILYPTDTVWGLGCDATNAEAVARIYDIKKRSESKALITLVGNLSILERTVSGIPEVAYQLLEVADCPLTIIYDHACGVADNLKADDGSLAVRLPHDDFIKALCNNFRRPIVSTSANISGEPTPALFREISPEIINAADYVFNSRRDDNVRHKSSTIIRLSEDASFKIIRK